MSHRRKRRHAVRGLLAALVPLCLTAPPVDGQILGALGSFFDGKVEALGQFVSGPPRPRLPEGVRTCESLYSDGAKELARRRDLFETYTRWLEDSYLRIRDIGPMPMCFPFEQDTLTTRLSQRLLEVNNRYLSEHRGPYLLRGYTDQRERDLGLAQRRAHEIQRRSPLPCRYRVARQRGENVLQFRQVHYTRDAAGGAPSCQR